MAFENHPTATATFGTDELPITDGEITLDEGTAPFGLGLITVPLMDEELLEELNPNAFPPQRVTINASTAEGADRTFDLAMMNRIVDHKSREVRVDLATDEYVLQSYADVADVNTRSYEANLRNLVNFVLGAAVPGTALEAGTTNADLTAYWSEENLMKNARAAVDTATWSTGSGTGNLTRVTGLTGLPVTTGFRFTLTANAGTYWDFRSEYLPVRVGQQVNARASVRASTSRPIRLLISFFEDTTFIKETWADVTTGTTFADLAVSGVAPLRATHARIIVRATTAASSGAWIEGTAFKVYEGTDLDNSYYDGNTPNTANYTYQWAGDPNESAAQRVAVVERPPALFLWQAGVSAWDFVTTLVNAAGLRLFCDEQRRWHLINPTTYALPGRVSARTNNTSEGVDEMGGLSGLYATGVVVRYSWTDNNGISRIKSDSAGVAGRVHLREESRPYPGPGMAQAILNKMSGQGRTQSVTVGTDYTATPGQEVSISLPGTADQVGRLTSVTFVLNTGLMELGSSGLIETPEGSIDLLDGSIDSLTGSIDSLTT